MISTMNERYLAVDWLLDHATIDREGFFDRSSFSAFDAVFVDPIALPRHWADGTAPGPDGTRRTDPERDRGFGRTMSGWMAKRREEADDLLRRRGGLLICRLHPRGEALEIGTPGAPAERVDRYSWLPHVALVDRQHQFAFPSNGRFVARRGQDVIVEASGSPFEEYLRTFEERISYSAVYQDLLSTPLERFATVLARNRVGDAVALEIPVDEGRLVLLPPLEGVSPSREADVLLTSVRSAAARSAFVAEPDWLPAYALPGEEALADELAGLVERRDTLQAKVEEIQGKLEEKTRFKRMLYGKGRVLFARAAADAFQELGFEVEPRGEIWRVACEEGNALVAMEASEDARIGLSAYRRLHREMDRAITEGEDPMKGILIVSGSRELDPRRRPTQFSAEVLRGCKAHGYCLLSSYQLHKMLLRALAEKSKKTLGGLRRLLLETDGELREAGES
jgi:hypothetical protein